MKSKVILGALDTAPYMPEAGEFRGYENLRVMEYAGISFNLLERKCIAESIRIWQEKDEIYATIVFSKEVIGDMLVGFDARRRE